MKTLKIILLLLFISCPAFCKKGKLYFKNGSALSGEIIMKSKNTVVVVFNRGSMEFPRGEIQKIVYSSGRQFPREEPDYYYRNKTRENNYDELIMKYSYKYKVSPFLVKSIIRVESNFNPGSVSCKGAAGLMQVMPGTAKVLGVKQICDPEENIRAGVKFISDMLRCYGNDLNKALAAYNAGPGKLKKYNNDIPPYRETREYIYNVQKFYNYYKNRDKKRVYSFSDEDKHWYFFNE